MRDQRWRIGLAIAACVVAAGGCAEEDGGDDAAMDDHGDDHHDEGHDDHGHSHGDDNAESEVFTRVELTFTPESGDPIVAAFSDPDGDGGMSGTSDPITLATNTAYTLGVTFGNDLADPYEDVTPEIRDEAEEHQLFFSGDAMDGLLTHEYADRESDYADNAVGDDLVVGLMNRTTSGEAGTGRLTVQLQHLPDLNGEVVKVPGLEDAYPDVPGWPDVVVDFEVTVE